jgi:hypothetical protein
MKSGLSFSVILRILHIAIFKIFLNSNEFQLT